LNSGRARLRISPQQCESSQRPRARSLLLRRQSLLTNSLAAKRRRKALCRFVLRREVHLSIEQIASDIAEVVATPSDGNRENAR
jgi:hypothetical protein